MRKVRIIVCSWFFLFFAPSCSLVKERGDDRELYIPVLSETWQLVLSITTIDTNLPFFYGQSFEIVNTSSYDLEVWVSGRRVAIRRQEGGTVNRLPPTETGALFFRNYSGNGAQASVTLKAWQADKLVGSASRQVYVYYNYQRADVWHITNETFRRPRYSW